MKIVIPAKVGSERLANKNFRPFHKGQSLFDIKAGQLRAAGVAPGCVYVSSEDECVRSIVEEHGFRFLLRPRCFADNAVPMGEVFMEILRQLPDEDDIMYVQVIDPLFDEYGSMLEKWRQREPHTDSLLMVRKVSSYLLDAQLWPINCRFGPWHVSTQDMPIVYSWTACCQIITRVAARLCRYYVGASPARFVTDRPFVNIKTESDMELAATLFERQCDAGKPEK